jgi:hypothetical protein
MRQQVKLTWPQTRAPHPSGSWLIVLMKVPRGCPTNIPKNNKPDALTSHEPGHRWRAGQILDIRYDEILKVVRLLDVDEQSIRPECAAAQLGVNSENTLDLVRRLDKTFRIALPQECGVSDSYNYRRLCPCNRLGTRGRSRKGLN